MGKQQRRRQLHRAVVPLAAVPLVITAASGSLYGVLQSNGIDAFWLIKLHTGNFGVVNLQPIYSVIIGVLTLILVGSGIALYRGGRQARPGSSGDP